VDGHRQVRRRRWKKRKTQETSKGGRGRRAFPFFPTQTARDITKKARCPKVSTWTLETLRPWTLNWTLHRTR
jgi:hypothetical protein